MTPDMIYLKALVRNAEKLPTDFLPDLGRIAYYGLTLVDVDCPTFSRALLPFSKTRKQVKQRART